MVSAFVVVIALALVAVSALVVDGGRMLTEAREAGNVADAAARAGAQAISDDLVREGSEALLDPAAAVDAACAFLGNTGRSCGGGTGVVVEGNTVTVTVRGQVDLLLLPGASKAVSARGTACVAAGITAATC